MMKIVPVGGIITSKIDPNYYVIKTQTISETFMLATLLQRHADTSDGKYSYCNIIMEYANKLIEEKLVKYPLFVEKNSDFGNVITNLIKKGELKDEGNYISKTNIINALINEMQNPTLDLEYLNTISSLIKMNQTGSINELSNQYPKESLEKMIQNGSEQTYLRNLNDALTGKEEGGYLYQDNSWYQFNIMTKSYEKIEEKKKIKRM